ncbi:hypothetical protein SAMN05216382_3110 [Sphingomonas palmae]|uniref:Uncharacterized protein n=1 Tax=Sphingomonas palmae TaxID=1855283 RepID=A0A1H7UXX8_9SPHN|nr:hypothetical protein [Sphingomonas palmae]SEM01639.1 hypothetical protein SAMN05216382_3110 [Sphingomonas palmae]
MLVLKHASVNPARPNTARQRRLVGVLEVRVDGRAAYRLVLGAPN